MDTQQEIKAALQTFKAERQYAKNRIDDAQELGNESLERLYEIVHNKFDEMISEIEKLITN
jgi:hypothetical protein